MRSRPQVPSPSATPTEVRLFLTNFFLALDDTISQTEAENEARKIKLDGKGLYELSPEQWLEEYDIQGQTIYNELQESRFGHVCFLLCLDRLSSLEEIIANSQKAQVGS